MKNQNGKTIFRDLTANSDSFNLLSFTLSSNEEGPPLELAIESPEYFQGTVSGSRSALPPEHVACGSHVLGRHNP